VIISQGFVPPTYPYDRLDQARAVAAAHPGGAVDCSIGTPCDAPIASVVAALSGSGSERGYPASIGSVSYREAAAAWLELRLGVVLDPATDLAACIGTKEFVVSLPQYLRLRRPDLDTVLYPAISYPSYAMGATLAGCRAVPVPLDSSHRIDVGAIDPGDAARALCLWVNTPGNPAGGLDDLAAAAAWGRANDVIVASDECYVEFTWDGPARTILSAGNDGLLAVHSLSKRSNLAGVRAGFYAGDAALVHYLREVRKHAGLMVPGPVQAAAVAAWSDQDHVEVQRQRYVDRLGILAEIVAAAGVPAPRPAGAFYLWVAAPDGDAWALTDRLAAQAGLVVSPGEFYGAAGAGYVRIAAVQPDAALEMARDRLG
jgi:succinyldiaminopimelate transaminase